MSRAAVVLVVDDDEAGRYAKVRLVRGAGYKTLEAASGGAALEAVATQRPEIVLLDVKLPDISGIEVCRRIKAAFDSVIVLQTSAAFTDGGARAEGLDSGADAYLSEPLEANELLATLRAMMRLRDAEQGLRQLNLTLEQRVRERTQQLADANQHLVEEMQRREKAEMALRQSQKMEALGQLTGGVAHDFNNLLTVIRGNLEMMEASRRNPDKLARHINAAQQAVGRGERLTSQLLAFSRHHTVSAERVDLGAVLREFGPMLRHAIGERIELTLDVGIAVCPVRVDTAQFEAAILNLAVNARDAMPDGGRLGIGVETVAVGEGGGLSHPEAPPGEYCRVTIEDTGVGMSREVAERAFEPFFTTKDIGKGTGLGLAQVYGFVKQSRGYVSVETAPSRGTTIALLLPRAPGQARPAAADAEAGGAPASGTETVLVVEDDAHVRDVVVTMIEDLGYHVLIASDARDALERLRQDETIDLLFSDIVMPGGLGGVDLARAARQARPELAVLLTSGFPRGSAGEELGFAVLRKPYRRAELAQTLRSSLAGRRTSPADAG
jgi:signal transduction histidine kinase